MNIATKTLEAAIKVAKRWGASRGVPAERAVALACMGDGRWCVSDGSLIGQLTLSSGVKGSTVSMAAAVSALAVAKANRSKVADVEPDGQDPDHVWTSEHLWEVWGKQRNGHEGPVGINPHLLVDLLTLLGGGEHLTFFAGGPTDPISCKGPDGSGFIMPRRL